MNENTKESPNLKLQFGGIAAAWATLISFVMAAVMCLQRVGHHFRLSIPRADVLLLSGIFGASVTVALLQLLLRRATCEVLSLGLLVLSVLCVASRLVPARRLP